MTMKTFLKDVRYRIVAEIITLLHMLLITVILRSLNFKSESQGKWVYFVPYTCIV